MIAVDTNVVVRLLTRDDPIQADRADALFERKKVYICKTVLLETEWVLRFSYGLENLVILKALTNVLGLPNVTVEDNPVVVQALSLFESGMDFADALHLASSKSAIQFATFDERLKKRAGNFNRQVILA